MLDTKNQRIAAIIGSALLVALIVGGGLAFVYSRNEANSEVLGDQNANTTVEVEPVPDGKGPSPSEDIDPEALK